ncbi:hypothetical protein M1293_03595 [Candidatus Parvarchaeota archaeon]|nr:hypothetical protein [Candidatus Parvarchaeota archaeon]
MEDEEELKELYRKVLENMTLYNQYRNNVKFDKASEISELVMKINDLAIKNGIYNGDLKSEFSKFEKQLEEQERNRAVCFL